MTWRKKDNGPMMVAQLLGIFFLILILSLRRRVFSNDLHSLIVSVSIFVFIFALIMVVLMFCFYSPRRKRRDPQTSSCLEVKRSKISNASLGKECALKADSQSSPISSSNLETNLPSNQIIKKIRAIDWYQFEQAVGVVYRKLGYSVTRKGGANPDGGIDLIIEKNEEKIAVQCKQWKTWNVGVKAVREFLGALSDSGLKWS